MIASAKRYSKKDEVLSMTWIKANSTREAFINEYLAMERLGGPWSLKHTNTYNKIWSPGKKYYNMLK